SESYAARPLTLAESANARGGSKTRSSRSTDSMVAWPVGSVMARRRVVGDARGVQAKGWPDPAVSGQVETLTSPCNGYRRARYYSVARTQGTAPVTRPGHWHDRC